jgi:hypothetical protein
MINNLLKLCLCGLGLLCAPAYAVVIVGKFSSIKPEIPSPWQLIRLENHVPATAFGKIGANFPEITSDTHINKYGSQQPKIVTPTKMKNFFNRVWFFLATFNVND